MGISQFVAFVLQWASVVVMIIGLGLGNVAYADQGTGGYPWTNAKSIGLFSDWYIDENGNGRRDGTEAHDNNGFAYRNCTSYVAWKLESLGVKLPYGRLLGHAKTWDDNARNYDYDVDDSPRVGDAAVWNKGPYGHVAYVEAVDDHDNDDPDDDTVTVSEYNVLPRYGGRYSRREGVQADSYIHFLPEIEDIETSDIRLPAPPLSRQETVQTVVEAAVRTELAPPEPKVSLEDAAYLLADIDGDYSKDIVALVPPADGARGQIVWQLTGQQNRHALALPDFLSEAETQWLSGDVTGDKKEDIVAIKQGGSGWDVYVLGSSGDKLQSPAIWSTFTVDDEIIQILLGDRDSDGQADLYIITQGRGEPEMWWLRADTDAFNAIKPI